MKYFLNIFFVLLCCIPNTFAADSNVLDKINSSDYFIGADLTDARFSGNDFMGYYFNCAYMQRSYFEKSVHYDHTTFKEAHLNESEFEEGSDLNNSDFTDADLSDVDLHGSNVSKCDFTNANLSDANLKGTIFFVKKDEKIIQGAIVKDADFKDAKGLSHETIVYLIEHGAINVVPVEE